MNPGDTFPTTFFASIGGNVLITGYYVTGDYYGVYVDNSLVLTTNAPASSGVDYGDQTASLYSDPASGYASGLFSSGEFSVHAGDFITIEDLNPPGGIGEAAVEYGTATPEPACLGLIVAALSLALLLRHKLGFFGAVMD